MAKLSSTTIYGDEIITGKLKISEGKLQIDNTAVTATAAELNTLDGITADVSELNKLDGFIGDSTDLNYAKSLYDTGVTSTEFDTALDGITTTATEINTIRGTGTVQGISQGNSPTFVKVTAPLTGEVTGNASTATALKNSHTFDITGDITATAISFNGTGDVNIVASVNDDSHNHKSANISDATNVNTANMIVKRDASGNFAAGTITATTQSASDNSTKVATTAYTTTAVGNAISSLIDASPATLDTLNELAASLNDDANFAGTMATALGTKLNLSGGAMTGAITGMTSLSVIGNISVGGTVDGIDIASNASTNSSHRANVSNPHSVTKSQVGLGSVDNTSDANKPVSTASQTALDLKLNKSGGIITGSLGIGLDANATPAADLHVYCPADGGVIFQCQENDSNGDMYLKYGYNGYGWYHKYKGSGSGDDNEWQLWSEGAGGTDQQAFGVKQSGIMTFMKDATFNGNISVGGTVDGIDIANHNHDDRYYTKAIVDSKEVLNSSIEFTATAGATVFNAEYTPGYIDVFVNGIKLEKAGFTATNGTSITLANACQSADIVSISALKANAISSIGYSRTELDSLLETKADSGNLEITNSNVATNTGNLEITNSNVATNTADITEINSKTFGQGQTWQDVTSLRQDNVTYTNDTNKPIIINMTSKLTTDAIKFLPTIDGVGLPEVFYNGDSQTVTYQLIVAPNSTYKLRFISCSIGSWWEFR